MRPYDTEDPLAVDCFAGRTKLSILTPLLLIPLLLAGL